MIKPALYPYLSNRLFFPLKIKQLGSIVLFYSNSFTACFVKTFFDNSICTTANLVTEVIADQIWAIGGGEFPKSAGFIHVKLLVD